MPRENRKKFSCDFETTTDRNDCRVWAFGCMEIGKEDNFIYGNSIEQFMAWAEKSQCDCYFMKLPFDGDFIVNYLLSNDWKYIHDKYPKRQKPKTFTGTFSANGEWYKLDLFYGYERGSKGKPRKKHTAIYDAKHKLPYSVKELAEAFNMPFKKGEIDYHAPRPIGHKITEEELDYLKRDVQIVARALHSQFEQGMTGMTIGVDAMNDFKNMIGKERYKRLFPDLGQEVYEDLHAFYYGGYNWLNDPYEEKVTDEGITFDFNSNYPAQLVNKPMPYGYPEFFVGKYEYDEEYPLYVQMIKCDFTLKDGYIPMIQVREKGYPWPTTQYLKSSEAYEPPLFLTGMELELFLEHYRTSEEPDYICGWKFKAATGLFDDYVNKWLKIKNDNRGTARGENAKLMLNNLPGKFGSGIDRTRLIPRLKEDGSTFYEPPEEENNPGVVKIEYGKPSYIPVAIFVTSYARCELVRIAQACGDRFIYSDTDSVTVEGLEIPDILKDRIHESKLGFMKIESVFEKAYYIKPKTYVQIQYAKIDASGEEAKVVPCSKEEATIRKKSIKCSGMPDKVKDTLTFKQFRRGLRIMKGPQRVFHVKGGVVLEEVPFSIK